MTDFKIVGLELKELDWKWGVIPAQPLPEDKKENVKAGEEDQSTDNVKKEDTDLDLQVSVEDTKAEKVEGGDSDNKKDIASSSNLSTSQGAFMARMRIYFHTPPNADDARPIIPVAPASDVRKGKRKKLDDDDADEERREPPPPPLPSGADGADSDTTKAAPSLADVETSVGRGSVAPSITTEAASEAEWLMAAIAEGDGDADGDADAEGEVDAYEETQIDGMGEEIHDHDGKFLGHYFRRVFENVDELHEKSGTLIGKTSTKLTFIFFLFFPQLRGL